MAGHSHSANIAIKKGKLDARRGKLFSKLSKDIMVAARGGPDPEFNFGLRHAVEKARAASMPNDKIEYAIKRGSGQIAGLQMQDLLMEAYAPGGVAVLIQAVSDHPNRTRPELASILEKTGGKPAAANAVAWLFKRRGLLAVKRGDADEDRLMEVVLEAGAEDVSAEGEFFEVLTGPETFEAVRKALEEARIPTAAAEVRYLADNEVELAPQAAAKVLKLLDALEDHEEVTQVHSNLKYTQAILELLKSQD